MYDGEGRTMEEDRDPISLPMELMLNVLFPFRVYEDCGMSTPEGNPLLTLEAGFREKKDAELFAGLKAENENKKYVVKSSME